MTFHEQWIALITIINKEINRFMRIWVQTLLPPVITMVLYLLIFGALIGTRIGEMGGFSYVEFVVPGLIMMSIITSSYANVVASFFGAKFQRSIEELLVSPTPNYIILLGFLIGGVIRGVLIGLIVTVISLFFIKLPIHNLAIVVSIALLTAIVFAMTGFINGIFARSFDDISIIPTFVLTPLTYLGGVFYSINLLPEFWQWVSKLNPILYMINAFRYGILGVADTNISHAFFGLSLFVVVLFSICLFLLERGARLRS
jgi:ABC-2 type transport system permease protein